MRIVFGLVLLYVLNAGATVTHDSNVYIEGYVRDINGLPIKGATVDYNGVKSITDDSGCFFFGGVNPPGKITIKISHPDYVNLSTTLEYGLYVFNVTLPKFSGSYSGRVYIAPISDDEARKKGGCKST